MAVLSAPLPVRPGSACAAGCGRELSPGPARHTRHVRKDDGSRAAIPPSGTCIHCLSKSRKIAIPRARAAIRAGIAGQFDPREVPAIGRGPNRRAARKARATERRARREHDAIRKVMARAFRSIDDKARRAEIVARQHVEGKAA